MKKILVVVDVQNDFISGSLANEEAQKKVANIKAKIDNFKGDHIFVTRDTHEENYLETKEGQKLPVKHCINGTWGWYIEDTVARALHSKELKEDCAVTYISKPTFGSEELIEKLDSLIGNDNVEIEFVGFCTDICVLSNAIPTKTKFYEQAEVFVDANCCAGVTVESHNAALTSMKMCQINVVNE